MNDMISARLGRSPRPSPSRVARVATVAVLLALAGSASAAAADGREPVTSLMEMRRANTVIQKWDLSCGAGALAILLNYQHGDRVGEREIAMGLISRQEYIDDPMLVHAREGFSLLDLERYVGRRGYEGIGYGKVSFDQLVDMAPAIVPVNLLGYDHFVVFRGVAGDRVLLADPAYGNRTMPRERFEKAWLSSPELGHVAFVVARRDGLIPPNRLAPRPEDFVIVR